MKHAQALAIAQDYLREFSPACERIEIAGSIRRGKEDVHDIELVAIPKPLNMQDLFGNPTGELHALTAMIDMGFYDMRPGTEYKILKGGSRYKQLELPEGIILDLFIVLPPAQWGVIYTLRTGPAEFGHWLVTQRRKGGCMPLYAEQRGGCVYAHGKPIAMPEEIDYLAFLGLEWIEPRDRKPRWYHAPVLPVLDMPKNASVTPL